MTFRYRCNPSIRSSPWLLTGLILLCPAMALGQTVRGVVHDQVTSRPAAGAIVTLERFTTPFSKPQDVYSVLTDESGTYAIRTTAPGTHRIHVRRIGSKPYRSDVFSMDMGEVRRLDVHLEAVDNHSIEVAELGRITILRATPCPTETLDAVRIANLWDDARTALMATEISTRDNLAPRRMIRFVRDLDPGSLDVLTETVYGFNAPTGGRLGFTSPSGDSLSTIGYWRRINKSSFRFYGPDANALLSHAFVEDHCFSIASDRQRVGQVGLSFEPVEQRKGRSGPAEITGTVWIDSTSSELRSLEFNWLSFPVRGPTEHLGGEVRFTRLPSGSWFVHRWRLRMPTEVMAVDKGTQVTRTRRFGIVEEGGVVETGIRDARGTATISGTVRDGDGNALAGARVNVVGMGRLTTTDALGHYRFDSLPAGLHSVVVGHPRYDLFGVRAGDSQVLLDDGASRELSFRGPGAQEVSDLLCEGAAQKGRGTLHLTIIDSATARPMRGLRVLITDNEGFDRGREFTAEDETDASGVVVFCNTPPSKSITLSARVGKSAARVELKMPRAGLTTQVVRWPGAIAVKM